MKNNVTCVTAFFDIGRGKFNIIRCEPRSADKYMEYFDFWAGIQNKLIIYTSPQYKQKILEIRKKHGREAETIIIDVENIFDVEKDIYKKMMTIEQNENFKNFRYWSEEVSNRADYDYIMLMKYWCMNNVVERKINDGETILWIDFGFNHGGECYSDSSDFTFLADGMTNGHIQLYSLPQTHPEKVHSILSLQYQFDTIMGSIIAVPANKCKFLWNMTKQAMLSLLSLDCIDDDQQLLLMAYKLHPEEFEIHSSNWFMPLKEFWGGNNLTVKTSQIMKKRSLPRRIVSKIKRILTGKNINTQKKAFMSRVKETANRFYK